MEKNEAWENDCESSEGEMKGVAYTIISLVGGIITLGVGLLVILY